MPHPQRGFSLVELAIVLVIIGLIVGGILTGQDLIRASELNSVVADANKYKTAINTFRIKYNGLPGDLKNAESYWGTQHATAATCSSTASTTTATCNGDGDGRISYSISYSPRSAETFRLWQHLANAGLIPGSFTGSYGAGGAYAAVVGTNVPESQIKSGGFIVQGAEDGGWTVQTFFPSTVNYMTFGAAPGNGGLVNPIISNAEAYSIDAKNDDGLPGFGEIQTMTAAGLAGCASSSTASSAAYNLSITTAQACNVLFKLNN